ncbi:MAG TPA: ATP synthase F1 subunit gamma [Oscillospiraceae bacterium]|nr:ATP synthase F1 subunit gamma [Oscillospiraceae bacterium]
MQSVSDIKRHIKSNTQIYQITRAMYLISVSKMRRAMDLYKSNTAYFTKVRAAMKDIIQHTGGVEHPFLRREILPNPEAKHAYIVIAGDKGMAGAYNHNVLNAAFAHMQGNDRQKYIFTVGQIAGEFFSRHGFMADMEFLTIDQNPSLRNARLVTDTIVDLYRQKLLDEVYIVYTKMVSSVAQEPKIIRLLPVLYSSFDDVSDTWEEEGEHYNEILYESSPKQVMDTLIPQYLIGTIYGALVQSYASGHIARMNAMTSATHNAEEMLRKLRLDYNRARQAAITREMTEIVSGVNALSSAH